MREVKYYGVAACLEIWKCRPDDIIRVYLTNARMKQFGPLLKWAAAQRKAYHIVEEGDLEKLTESIHHQGVCLLARERPRMGFSQMAADLKKNTGPMVLAYLDGVENPHNLGAIVRTCAHFGVRYIIGEQGHLPSMSPSSCRVAEGGAEHVDIIALTNPDRELQQLHDMGFAVVTTAANGTALYQHPFARRTLVVMGAEETGVSKHLLRKADATLAIPGTGAVESLNVSVAFGVVVGEYCRQHPPAS